MMYRLILGCVALAIVLPLCLPHTAHADAPGTRLPPTTPTPVPIGGTLPRVPGELPPIGFPQAAPQAGPFAAPQAQAAQPAPGVPNPWMNLIPNPGNWMLNAGMGVVAGVLAAAGELVQFIGLTALGVDAPTQNPTGGAVAIPIVPQSCMSGDLTNYVFCSPPGMTYQNAAILAFWAVLKAIATALMTILLMIRIGRMATGDQVNMAKESEALLVRFAVGIGFISAPQIMMEWIIGPFNLLSGTIIGSVRLAFPTMNPTSLDFASRSLGLLFWCALVALSLKRFFQVLHLAGMISIAPIMGALIFDRATESYFAAWLRKIIELLFAQIGLTLNLALAAAFLDTTIRGKDSLAGFIVGILTLLAATFGGGIIGLATSAGNMSYLEANIAGRAITAAARVGGRGLRVGAEKGADAARGVLSAARGQGWSADSAAAARRAVRATTPEPGWLAQMRRVVGRDAPAGGAGSAGRAGVRIAPPNTVETRSAAAIPLRMPNSTVMQARFAQLGGDQRLGRAERRAVTQATARDMRGDSHGATSDRARSEQLATTRTVAQRERSQIASNMQRAQASAYAAQGNAAAANHLRSNAAKQERVATGAWTPPPHTPNGVALATHLSERTQAYHADQRLADDATMPEPTRAAARERMATTQSDLDALASRAPAYVPTPAQQQRRQVYATAYTELDARQAMEAQAMEAEAATLRAALAQGELPDAERDATAQRVQTLDAARAQRQATPKALTRAAAAQLARERLGTAPAAATPSTAARRIVSGTTPPATPLDMAIDAAMRIAVVRAAIEATMTQDRATRDDPTRTEAERARAATDYAAAVARLHTLDGGTDQPTQPKDTGQ